MLTMLTTHALSARVDDRPVFDNLSFSVNAGDVLGVVGPNGSGKTTLISILVGQTAPSSGTVQTRTGTRVGWLRQGFADQPDGTLTDLLDQPSGGLVTAMLAAEGAAAAMATDSDPDAAIARYDAALQRFDALGGYPALDRLSAVLGTFFIDPTSLSGGWRTPLGELSGGQKTRAGLAALVASRPDVLLLDEPTNHLDQAAAAVLEDVIRQHDGAAIIVSHDRAFLDRVATAILAFDDQDPSWTLTAGNYSDYLAQREHERERQSAAYHRQQDQIARVEANIREAAGKAARIEGETQHFYYRTRAKNVARSAVVRERRLERLLASEERVDRPERRWDVAADLPPAPPGGRDVAIVTDLMVELGGRRILDGVDLHITSGEHVALLGANGAGKTTLLRCITGELQPTAGSVRLGANIIVGRFSQEQEQLMPDRTPLDHIRSAAAISESDARTFLHRFLFSGDMALRPAERLSYGERARLALAMVVLKGANFLVLDEPLNHLDLVSREQFESALETFTGTMVMVLHDQWAIETLAARAVLLRDGRLTEAPLPV